MIGLNGLLDGADKLRSVETTVVSLNAFLQALSDLIPALDVSLAHFLLFPRYCKCIGGA